MGIHETLVDTCSQAACSKANVSPTDPFRGRVHITSWGPAASNEWASVIEQAENANLAHAPQWFVAISNAYGHTPLYLQAQDSEGQGGVLPAFLVRSRLFGTVVSSMPFLDTGGPCSTATALSPVLVDALMREAKRLGAGSVELRCTSAMNLSVPAVKDKVNLVLPLPHDPDHLWRQLSAKVRNQIRKAERSGLSVEFGRVEKLADFYEVFAANMRDLGSPVHARDFFNAMLDAFGSSIRIASIRKGAMPIGGLVALAFKDTIVVPWASSLRQYFSLCPNMLLYWETIRAACVEGFRKFDFGRSSHDSNTYRFKRQWGALEEPLFWYTIPVGSHCGGKWPGGDQPKALFAQVWQRLPLNVTRWLGPRIRKYITL